MPFSLKKFKLEDKIDGLGGFALIVRDFINSTHSTECNFFFSPNGKDKWYLHKNAQFNLSVQDGIVIDTTNDDTEQYHKTGILRKDIDKEILYKQLINTVSEWEYAIDKQDNMIEALLRDIFQKFDTKTNFVDIFVLARKDDVSEYKERVNGLLSILRLEHMQKIKVYDFWRFYEDGMEFPLRFEKWPLWVNDISIKRDIFLDEKNGDVFLNDNNIGTIPYNTQPYWFFLYLYRNYGKSISYLNMYNYLQKEEEQTIESYSENMVSKIKSRLPDGIKQLVSAEKKHYRLSTDSMS